jgi:hypothetical protein
MSLPWLKSEILLVDALKCGTLFVLMVVAVELHHIVMDNSITEDPAVSVQDGHSQVFRFSLGCCHWYWK